MFWWVMHDVPSARRLQRLARLCTGSGLCRIQKSVFIGELDQERIVRLQISIKKLLNPEEDRVLLVPTTKHQLKSATDLGLDSGLGEIADPNSIVYI